VLTTTQMGQCAWPDQAGPLDAAGGEEPGAARQAAGTVMVMTQFVSPLARS
jgi:hypothetical protein